MPISVVPTLRARSWWVPGSKALCWPRPAAAGFDSERFWKTAARRASVARAVADHMDPSRRSESFTAALLQDMAIPVLIQARGQEYLSLLQGWYAGDGDVASMEREAFDWDRGQVAKRMCECVDTGAERTAGRSPGGAAT